MTAALVAVVLGYEVFSTKTSLDSQRFFVDASNDNSWKISLSPIQTRNFYDESDFQSACQNKSTTVANGRIIAGLVNHHALAQDLIARFFISLKAAEYSIERVIILSPDHNKAGRAPVSSHLRPYATPDGLAEVDEEFIDRLTANNLVTLENGALFEQEHGLGALVPFLHHEFLSAKIVPLAVRGDAMKDDLRNFGRSIVELLDDKTVIIVSSDMSHYLSEDQALKNDEETLGWLESFNALELVRAADDHLDNGAAMAILDGVFFELNIEPQFTMLDHSISVRYGADPNNTTSYITGFWVVW